MQSHIPASQAPGIGIETLLQLERGRSTGTCTIVESLPRMRLLDQEPGNRLWGRSTGAKEIGLREAFQVRAWHRNNNQ